MMSGEVLELDAESSTTLNMSKIGMEDVDLIVQHWNYETDTTRDYVSPDKRQCRSMTLSSQVSFLIEWKETVGVYVQHKENTRSLVAWAIEGRDGSIEMIFSLPEWRHHGLARATLHQLTTILLRSYKLQRWQHCCYGGENAEVTVSQAAHSSVLHHRKRRLRHEAAADGVWFHGRQRAARAAGPGDSQGGGGRR